MELKDKIINSAYELLAEKGYEKTTVSDIISLAGCSKGGFYHHFKSKYQIVEAITMNYTMELRNRYEEIIQKSDSSVIELLNDIIIEINQYKEEQIGEWQNLSKIYAFSGSETLIRKMAEDFEQVTTEYYTKLITKGTEEGLFSVEYPEFLAGLWTREILRIYGSAKFVIFTSDSKEIKEFENLLEFSEKLVNSTLGFESSLIQIKKPTLAYIEYARKQTTGKNKSS